MGKSGSKQNNKQRHNIEVHIQRDHIAIIISILAVIVSGIVYTHQQNIEESTLKMGYPQYTYDQNIYPAIRIPLINGYYARYQTQIITDSVSLNLNGKKITLQWIPPLESENTTLPKNFALVERDKPTYLKLVFFNESEYVISEYDRINTIKYVVPKYYLKLLKENNDLIVTIHYIDFSKMKEFVVASHITFEYDNLGNKISSVEFKGSGTDGGVSLPEKKIKLSELI